MTDWTPLPDAGEPAPDLVLDDADLIAELAHPQRSALLHRLRSPRSAAELAEDLDLPVTRLYHHLHRLEELGLIEAVATRRSGSKIERRYRATSRRFRIDPDAAVARPPAEVATVLGSMFDVTRNDLRREISGGSIDASALGSSSTIAFLELSLRSDQVDALRSRLAEMLREITVLDDDTTAGDGAQRFRVLVAAFPLSD